MRPNRFQQAKQIYHAALEREPALREAYVSEACAGDEALLTEIESLLGLRAEAEAFFAIPAFAAGARALTAEPDFTGRTLSHYAILEKIGEGGMGVVYQARDTHLDRLVALKMLRETAVDPVWQRRFVQEAKAASALNHPNIIVIHDIDTAAGITFIAMELVQGTTLNRLIRGRGITLNEALKYGAQIADALAAAHRAGIVHRDIKPANIMITDSGFAKVLDFGLAKLTDSSADALPASRVSGQTTRPGVILGTVAYMSPEQAQGKDVDARCDVFSLGAVLYEMVTRRRPFDGDTNASTLAAILRDEPTPVSLLEPQTPSELDRVINRCLRKNPDRRFQHMADLKVALEELRDESDSGARVSATPPLKARRRLAWISVACLLSAAFGAAWFGLTRPRPGPIPLVATFTGLRGVETNPALSPDGRQLAFAWNGEDQDNFDIFVQLVDETTRRRLTTDPARDYSPVWSPDALRIAFLRDSEAGTEIVIIPAAGGTERKIRLSPVRTDWPVCGLAWSPDGRFLAIVDRDSEQAPNSIFLIDTESREMSKATTPAPGSWDGLPVFSPDGRTLAFTHGRDRPLSDIYTLRLSERGQPLAKPRRITYDNTFIFGLDWTADGCEIVFSSTRGGIWALWRVAASGGEPQRLPVGGNNAFWPSISRTGNRLAYSEGVADWNVWKVAAPGVRATEQEAAAPVRISASPQADMEPAFSPDGRMIAWSSMHSGSHQIWVSNSDGTEATQLTRFGPPGAAEPVWSPDGKQIAFTGYGRGPYHTYLVGADGGSPRRLTSGDFNEDSYAWSHDGRWVYFGSDRGGGAAIWKAPSVGGAPIFLANGFWPVESPDGRFVYYSGSGAGIWKVPAGGGSPILLARNGWGPFESFDGKFVYYSGSEPSIWRLPIGGGEPALVSRIGERASWTLASRGIYVLDPDARGGPALEFFPFAAVRAQIARLPGKPDSNVKNSLSPSSISPDGRWIVYAHADRAEADIMLVKDFR